MDTMGNYTLEMQADNALMYFSVKNIFLVRLRVYGKEFQGTILI